MWPQIVRMVFRSKKKHNIHRETKPIYAAEGYKKAATERSNGFKTNTSRKNEAATAAAAQNWNVF